MASPGAKTAAPAVGTVVGAWVLVAGGGGTTVAVTLLPGFWDLVGLGLPESLPLPAQSF